MKQVLINRKPFIGRKKSAVAKCNVYESVSHELSVNGIPALGVKNAIKELFPLWLESPNLYKVWVKGGGCSAQQAAAVKSILRAEVDLNPEIKPEVKNNLYLWFDSRRVERKKVGRRKARKGQQWVKR